MKASETARWRELVVLVALVASVRAVDTRRSLRARHQSLQQNLVTKTVGCSCRVRERPQHTPKAPLLRGVAPQVTKKECYDICTKTGRVIMSQMECTLGCGCCRGSHCDWPTKEGDPDDVSQPAPADFLKQFEHSGQAEDEVRGVGPSLRQRPATHTHSLLRTPHTHTLIKYQQIYKYT